MDIDISTFDSRDLVYKYFVNALNTHPEFKSKFNNSSSLRCFSSKIISAFEEEGLSVKDTFINLKKGTSLYEDTKSVSNYSGFRYIELIANQNLTGYLAVELIKIMKIYGCFPDREVDAYFDYYTYLDHGICIAIPLFLDVGGFKRFFAQINFRTDCGHYPKKSVSSSQYILLSSPHFLTKLFFGLLYFYNESIGVNNVIAEILDGDKKNGEEFYLNANNKILDIIDSDGFCKYIDSLSTINIRNKIGFLKLTTQAIGYNKPNHMIEQINCRSIKEILYDADNFDIHDYESFELMTKELCNDADKLIELNRHEIIKSLVSNEIKLPLSCNPFSFSKNLKGADGKELNLKIRERLMVSLDSFIPIIHPTITMFKEIDCLIGKGLCFTHSGHIYYVKIDRRFKGYDSLYPEDVNKAYRIYYYEIESMLFAIPSKSLNIIAYIYDYNSPEGIYRVDGVLIMQYQESLTKIFKPHDYYTMRSHLNTNQDDIYINISLAFSPIVEFNNKYKEHMESSIIHRTYIDVSYDETSYCLVNFDKKIISYSNEGAYDVGGDIIDYYYIDPFSHNDSKADTLYLLEYPNQFEDPILDRLKDNPAITLSSLLKDLADQYNTTARPKRYFDVKKRGALTKKEQSYVKKRFKELVDREECLKNDKDDPRCYEKVSTDLSPKMKKRKSSYLKDYYEIYRPHEISTNKFIDENKRRFEKEQSFCPSAPKGLIRIAVETGLPIEALKQVYDIGIGAYASSGSRTGMSAEQWGYGRVYSFIMCYYHNDDGRYSSKRYLKNKTDFSIYEDIEDGVY